MQAFAWILGMMAALQFAGFIWKRPFETINNHFDKLVEWIHESCQIIPWLFFAGFIAIITQIYDIFLDSVWNLDISGDRKFESFLDVWRRMVTTGEDKNAQRDLVHSIQWIAALGMFYIYSLSWAFSVKSTKGKLSDSTQNLARGAFFGGFSALIGIVSSLVSYLGQNADLLLF